MLSHTVMDPHAFFRRAERLYYERDEAQAKSFFQPQPCEFIRLKHMENSETVVQQGKLLDGKEVRSFVDADCDTGVKQMVNIIFTPARPQSDDRLNPLRLNVPIPFTKDVFKYLSDKLELHKIAFEYRWHSDVRRISCGSITSLFMCPQHHHGQNNMAMFTSINHQAHIVTVFAHGGMAIELNYIRERLLEETLLPLSIHPLLIPVLNVEGIVASVMAASETLANEASTRTHYNTTRLGEEHFVAESKAAVILQHQCASTNKRLEDTTKFLGTLITWSQDLRDRSAPDSYEIAFKEANTIICHRLRDLQASIKSTQLRLRTTQIYNEVHRQSLDVKIAEMGNKLNLRIAEQSRDIAIDSRRDASAMKAIAVLTMLFLPGTFVSACFAMPLFNWDAPTASLVVNVRFWIYVVITIPATAIVLVLWRLWYQFGEWKQWQDRSGDATSSARGFVKEFHEWVRIGRPTHVQKVEGEVKKTL